MKKLEKDPKLASFGILFRRKNALGAVFWALGTQLVLQGGKLTPKHQKTTKMLKKTK